MMIDMKKVKADLGEILDEPELTEVINIIENAKK